MKSHTIKAITLLAIMLAAVPGAALAQGSQTYVSALGPENPLVRHYYQAAPPLAHIEVSDQGLQYTMRLMRDGSLRLTEGLFDQPYLHINPDSEQVASVYEIVKDGRVTFEEKLALATLYAQFTEKPFQPPEGPRPRVPKARYLKKIEKSLFTVTKTSAKLRFLLNKAVTAPNQFLKLYYGAQARVLTLISNKRNVFVANSLWDSMTEAIDQGRPEVVPGSKFDRMTGVIAVHIMFKDEDQQAFTSILANLEDRLNAETQEMRIEGDESSGRAEAIKVRLEAVQKLKTLIEDGF